MDAELRSYFEQGIRALQQRAQKADKRPNKIKRDEGPLYNENPDHLRDDMALQLFDTEWEPAPDSQGKTIEGYTGRRDSDLTRREKGEVNYEKNQLHNY